jgi:hypothetical protein
MSKFKVGDVVRVWKPENTEQFPYWNKGMDRFHGTEQTISKVNVRVRDSTVQFAEDSDKYYFHFDWLEPCTNPAVEPTQPEWSWVPKGHTVIEMAVPDSLAKKIGAGNALVWKQANVDERYLSSVHNRVKVRKTRTDYYPVIVPTTPPPVPQYREPTSADVGKMVEVTDCEEENWQEYQLLAVLPHHIEYRFVVDGGENWALNMRYAQIKIEEDE